MNSKEELTAVIYKARWVDGVKDGNLLADAALADAILEAGFGPLGRIESMISVWEWSAVAFDDEAKKYRADGQINSALAAETNAVNTRADIATIRRALAWKK